MTTCFFFLMIRRPPRSTLDRSSAASDVYKRQALHREDREEQDLHAREPRADGGPARGDGLQATDQGTGVPSGGCLLYTSPSPRDRTRSRMPSSA